MHIKRISYIVSLILVLFLTNNYSHGQLPAPRIYLVTVNPETGYDSITWFDIPSPPNDYFGVGVRIPPVPGQPDSYLVINTAIFDTFYVNANTESASHSVGYTVWGVHPDGGGVGPGFFNGPDSTIFLKSVLDANISTITLKWNDYNTWRGSTANYNIYRRLGPYNYLLISSIPEGTNEYVITNIQVDQQYDLFVEAVNNDGIRRSTSNRSSVFTHITQLPGYINDVNSKSEIYPVPAGQVLYVNPNKSRDRIVRMDILNVKGEIIISDLPGRNGNDYPIPLDISMLPAGYYLCNLFYLNSTKQSLRFIK
jgi:hypothetical protein